MKDGKFDPELAERDKKACRQIHAKQVEKYGKEVVGDEPDLTSFPILLALVAERDGSIIDYAYFEANVEFCQGGVDPRATASLGDEAPAIVNFFRDRHFRMMRTYIPEVVDEQLETPLVKAGFQKQDQYTHYLLDMR